MDKQHGLPPQYRQYPIWQDRKPHEELYDIERDPEAIHNLACDPAYSDIKEELRDKLVGWMIETADLGLIDETEIVVRAAAFDGVSHMVGVHCDNFARILETADPARLGEEGRKRFYTDWTTRTARCPSGRLPASLPAILTPGSWTL